MELGKTSDDTFEIPTGMENTITLEHRPVPQGHAVEYNPREGTLAIISDVERQSLVGRPIEDDLRNENGQIVVSSRMVAERFGKRHYNVIRAIEDTISNGGERNWDTLFIKSQYQIPQNKQWYPEYLLTRDGFNLLAMGFTGKEALQIKLAYIEEFEKVEEIFKSQMPAPVNTKERTIEEVINIKEENGEILISGRELHEFLEIGTQYTKWFERMMEYGFVEGQDFVEVSQKRLTSHGREHSMTDHAMKIDMAKEISMLQRNEKGKEARQYFIKCEKKLREIIQSNTPALPQTYKDALIALVAEVEANEKTPT